MVLIFRFIEKHFWLFFILGIVVGLALPDFGKLFEPYLLWFLGGLLFLSYLTIDLHELRRSLHEPKLLTCVVILILFVTPVVFYYFTRLVYPSMALPVLILTAMPAGMSSPAFTKLVSGKVSLALVVVTLTTILVPFTAPYLIQLLVGAEVSFSLFDMMMTLVYLVFAPFILALIIRRLLPGIINKTKGAYGGLSIVLIVLIIMGPLALNADYLLDNVLSILPGILFLFLVSFLLHVVGWFSAHKRSFEDKKALVVCNAYMNFGMAIAIAAKFFSPEVVIAVLLYELPWDLMLIPLTFFAKRMRRA